MIERFDEVLAEASVLREVDAPRAEAWVSGLVAEWADLADLRARLHAAGPGSNAALDVACALVAIDPAAREVVGALADAGAGPRAAWADVVGTARPEQAWQIVDPFSGNVSVVVEYAHADDVRHSMLVEIEGDLAVDIHFGPAGLVDAAFDESDTKSLSVTELAVVDALERIAVALERTGVDQDPPITDEYVMNLPLAAARLALDDRAATAPSATGANDARRPSTAAGGVAATRPPRDPAEAAADAAAADTLRAALAPALRAPAPVDVLAAAAARVRAALGAPDTPDLDALAVDVALGDPAMLDDAALLATLAGAFVVPGALASFTPPEREAIRSLEWADWLGAVIPLVRAGTGADASPEQLVGNINRCPEVTTTVPKRDIPVVAEIFGRTLHAWELTGVLDADGRLTPLGAWLLPRALLTAWGAASA